MPGSIDNVLEFVIIEYRDYDPNVDEWDIVEVTDNYEITPQWGKITVINREVTIKPQDSLMYNGKAQSSTKYVVDSSSKNGLIDGHELVFSTSASLTKVGKAENLIVGEIKVYDKSGADITEYYTVTAVPGELEITKRPIKIVTPDKEKIYDGTALTSPTYILSTEDGFFGIADGDMLVVVVSGSRITVGSSPNSFTYKITNSRGEDVTDCYDATASSAGTLTVKPYATIVVWSGSDWKYYDGTPLTKNDAGYSVENGGKLLPGHRIELNAYGSQTEVGNSKNFVEVILIDSEGNRLSVGDYYEIDTSFGKLEVRAEGDPPGEKPKTIIYSVKGEKDGSLYLKTVSYGDYIGSGYVPFAAAEEYESCINGTHSAAYLASLSFKNSGLVSEKISVMVRGGTFALPYYASFDDTANIQQSDTVVVGDVGEGKQYSVNVYRPGYDDYLTDGVPSRYVKYESDYRRFVYENYLDVPASTKSYLEQIIISNGFNPSDPYIVEDIVQYFINSGITYDLDYNTALDESSDVVVAFLESYRSGVCRHFAAAAALMFRTMGVPARFTVGYYAYTQADEWVDVTDDMGHAWIEIYIDGIGWVMAEVTPPSGDNPANGGSGSGSGGSGGNGAGTGNGGGIPGLGSGPAKLPTQGSSKPTLEIQPVFLEKLYDGTPLNARTTTVRIGGNEVYKYLEGNLAFMDCIASNCFVEFEIEGCQDGVGESLSYVKSIKILNRRGADITDNYEIVTKPGKLFVYDESTPMIRVYLYEQQFGYDGRERSFLGDFDSDTPDYMHLYKSEGIGDYKLDINIGLVSADVVGSSEINNYIGQYITAYVDGEKFDGRVVVDVYDGYEYSKEGIYIPLRIDKRRIEITASVNADDPGNIVTGYSMTLNKPANGDQATVTVTYSVDNKLVTAKINTVSIRNKLGMDVTSCYEIITKNGTDTLEQ